jgi:hypothetical protein
MFLYTHLSIRDTNCTYLTACCMPILDELELTELPLEHKNVGFCLFYTYFLLIFAKDTVLAVLVMKHC